MHLKQTCFSFMIVFFVCQGESYTCMLNSFIMIDTNKFQYIGIYNFVYIHVLSKIAYLPALVTLLAQKKHKRVVIHIHVRI